MRASSRTLSLAFLFGTAIAVPAFAQQATVTVYPACTGTPTKADSDAAHGAYIAGKGSFDENDYARAVDYFKDAYRRDCTKHDLLNIIARAYELKGDRAEAVNALETYLKRVPPNEPGNEQIQRRIANLKAQIAAAPPMVAPIQSATTEPLPPGPVTPPPPAPDRPTTNRQHGAAPWIVFGAGMVLLAAGIPIAIVGANNYAKAKDTSRSHGCDPDTDACGVVTPPFTAMQVQDNYNSDKNGATAIEATGFILIGAGAIAAASGLIWHFTESTGPETRARIHPRIHPDVRPGYAGLSVGAQF